LSERGDSPLTQIPTTHLARWVVVDDAPFEGIPARVDHLESKYLLFTSNFDTPGGASAEPDRYLESLRSTIPDVMDALYSHCHGYPGSSDTRAFRDYMRRCQIETSFFFGAYPDATVENVLHALDAQRRFGAFVAEHQERQSTSDEVQSAFFEFMSALDALPTPRPGTLP
jgi:hypothetical protein